MTAQERLAKLQQQRAKIERQIRQQKLKLKTEERRKDTRRKIILGALVEKHCALNPDSTFARQVQKLINQYVEREQDRELFGLAPKPEKQETKTQEG